MAQQSLSGSRTELGILLLLQREGLTKAYLLEVVERSTVSYCTYYNVDRLPTLSCIERITTGIMKYRFCTRVFVFSHITKSVPPALNRGFANNINQVQCLGCCSFCKIAVLHVNDIHLQNYISKSKFMSKGGSNMVKVS